MSGVRLSMLLRGLALLGLALLASPWARAEDAAPTEAAILDVRVTPTQAVVGQQVQVTLTVHYLEAHFRNHAATLFRRPLDLEVQIAAPWLREVKGARVLAVEPWVVDAGPGDWVRLALNGDIASLPRTGPTQRDGRSWKTVTTGCTLVPTQAGALELAAPSLQYAYARTIEENLMGERTASSSTPVLIEGSPVTIQVSEPPAAGRPSGYGGAVGTFGVEARVATPEVEVGTPFELTVIITGEGNLGFIEQPRLEGLAGVHVYGATEDPPEDLLPTRRVIRYEVALTDGTLRAVPPVPFPYFDPSTASYQVARSAPIPLRVAGGASESSSAPAGPPGPEDGSSEPEEPLRPPLAFVVLAVVFGVLALLGWLWLVFRMRPRIPPGAVEPASEGGTARPSRAESEAALRQSLGSDDAELRYRAFAGFLAAHLDCGLGAVVGSGLGARLRAAGVPEEATARAVEAMEGLVDMRYGAPVEVTLDAALVDALVAALRTA